MTGLGETMTAPGSGVLDIARQKTKVDLVLKLSASLKVDNIRL